MASRYPGSGGFDVLHIGSAARDEAQDDPRGWRLGGGVTYAALTTARLGLRTAALIGVDPLASEARELDLLRDAGAELQLVPLAHGPRFDNVETPTGRIQTCLDPGDPVPTTALPDGWRSVPTWLIVPVAAETRDDWAAVVPDRAHLGLGWQGLLRTLVAGEQVRRIAPSRTALVGRADLVNVSRNDLGPDPDVNALIGLLRPGARLILTDGRTGGTVFTAGEPGGPPAAEHPYRSIEAAEIDPTGAGDMFMAAMVGALWGPSETGRRPDPNSGGASDNESGAIEAAIQWAAATAALGVERAGLDAVPTRAAVVDRLATID
jgi:sugar/nucleoside kinase (ribokinase family)